MSSDRRLKLPSRLVAELGIDQGPTTGRKKSRNQGSRKEVRKAEREQKKAARSGPPPQKRHKSQHIPSVDHDDFDTTEKLPQKIAKKAKKLSKAQDNTEDARPNPKSILKRTKKVDPTPSEFDSDLPSLKVSQKAIDKKKWGEDEEIDWLEQALGLKGKKRKKVDEFGDLLGELDALEDTEMLERKKSKAEGDEWLEEKRRKAKLAKGQDPESIEGDEDSILDEDLEGSEDDESASDISLDDPRLLDDDSGEDTEGNEHQEILDAEDDFEGFESDEDETEGEDQRASQPRVRENPYVAPTAGADASVKYIPPSMRKAASSDTELLSRLQRQTQGLVNRLTEANLIFLLGDVEKLYRENPRQHVTTTLVDLLLTSVCEPTILPDTLIILPAGFIAAVYKIIGTDFGAQVIQRIVELFDEHYTRAASDISKETSNLIMLLSEMYIFQVVGSNLIFDYVRLFLGKLSELNAELLLKIIRTSGPQLRQDDPSALKDIVAMLRPAVASVGEDNISVRTKFMIETINDLKNNKMRTGATASAITSEHTIRMKKTLGTLNTRNIKASEPLRIGLKDIRESDLKGKWWLVGASWSGDVKEEEDQPAQFSKTDQSLPSKRTDTDDTGIADLAQLAREQRMNTEVRRAIFVAIMSATDFQDAYVRLMKLQLKKKQEFEIPKVLIHCAGAEKSYNPYYTLIARRLCGDTKLRKSFQFSLWDLFKKMGETDDDDNEIDDDTDNLLDTRHIVNLAKMFGTLIVDGGLGIGVLKNLNLQYLQPKTSIFIEVLLISVLLQSQRHSETKRDEIAVVNVMLRIKDTPQLIRGLQYFLKKVISKTDIAGKKDDKKTVKWACKVASDTLQDLVVETV
ncbi:hypothetical protein B0O99DRAFT_549069 [Bisporella sp. PMI_857]|nr:hypothetical protein B0O99DRAFT_549069 [Bisporella sp. PMI_857]